MGATALYLTGFFHSFRISGVDTAMTFQGLYKYLPSTSMRGFGAPQAMLHFRAAALEWIAADLGLDPIDMRRQNGHTPVMKYRDRHLLTVAVSMKPLSL
jgi:xanthine dehydrogenase molybdopterin-binding subunit B